MKKQQIYYIITILFYSTQTITTMDLETIKQVAKTSVCSYMIHRVAYIFSGQAAQNTKTKLQEIEDKEEQQKELKRQGDALNAIQTTVQELKHQQHQNNVSFNELTMRAAIEREESDEQTLLLLTFMSQQRTIQHLETHKKQDSLLQQNNELLEQIEILQNGQSVMVYTLQQQARLATQAAALLQRTPTTNSVLEIQSDHSQTLAPYHPITKQ